MEAAGEGVIVAVKNNVAFIHGFFI